MKKNPFKSMIKSSVRALWKTLFKPVVKTLPQSPLRQRLMRAGGKIERREWWPKPTKHQPHNLNVLLIEELRELGVIEPALQPSRDFLNQLAQHSYRPKPNLENNSYGEAYGLLLRHLKTLNYDVVFLAPWLKRGGADLGLLHHINAQHEKGMRSLLITTEKAPSTWLDRLPASATHLDIAKFTAELHPHKSAELLARLLLQIPAQSIHNINSALGWDVFKKYGHQLKAMNKKIFASVFSEEEYERNIFFGYAHYLPETYRTLTGVFCDTQLYPKKQNQINALGNLMHTVYFPFLGELKPYAAFNGKAPVLWASRFAKEKRPELLYQIAKAMPEQEFHIYGEPERPCREELELLRALPNVKYFGKYDSFAKVAAETPYAAFLYTSQYDGLPNVLIEAIANGLPVISSDVGGISELIHHDTLLDDHTDFATNLRCIQAILADKALLHRAWQHSRHILETRHSWPSFMQVLENIDGYFPSLPQETYRRCYNDFRVLSKPLNTDI